jgi:hypothetical protein
MNEQGNCILTFAPIPVGAFCFMPPPTRLEYTPNCWSVVPY